MAGNVDTIREFLVSLGFKVDERGQKKFTDGVLAATLKVAELGIAVKTASAAVVASVTVIASQMEALYFASQRTGAAVENIQALGFAAAQMGSSAEAARGSLENLARFMRNSPGAEGLITSLGVQTRAANGALRDTTEILSELGGKFANMPYYRANAYAQALGIDEKTLMALREGMGQFGDDYKDMLAKAGMDSQEAAKSSHAFMNEVRALGSAFVILGQKVATSLTGKLSGDIRRFRDGLVDNFGRISNIVEKVAGAVLTLADIISTLALRGMQAIGAVVDWFNGLDGTTKMVMATVAALGVAWKVLNAGFLATPIGRIVALGTAILALYDDYKVWKEGGQTLIDWSKWEPGIKAAGKAISWLKDLLGDMLYRAIAAVDAVDAIIHKDWNRLKFAVGEFLHGNGKKYGESESGQPGAAPAPSPTPAPAPAAGDPRQPRGIRNNNPGNLNYVGQAGATREDDPNGRFAVFQSAEDGLRALSDQLRRYAQRGINSVRAIISRFAPPSENNTQAYIGSVSRRLGVESNAALDLNDPRLMHGLMDAIIRVENGRNPYSTEQLASASAVRAAGGQAAGAAPVSLTQTTTIHVTGAADAQGTAEAVGQAQSGVNQRLVRNMRTAVE
ncbi:MAG: hypothetical protein JO278_15875 [Dyella sp.]|nr:hypothetical protein [Dyella sp.]